MVLNDRSRNQIREEDQHGFKGIVQGLEYRLPTSAERLSHGKDLLSCWRGSIFITRAKWRILGDERGFYAKGSGGHVARLFWDITAGQWLCVSPQYGLIFK